MKEEENEVVKDAARQFASLIVQLIEEIHPNEKEKGQTTKTKHAYDPRIH
jgi:hypothetical protein